MRRPRSFCCMRGLARSRSGATSPPRLPEATGCRRVRLVARGLWRLRSRRPCRGRSTTCSARRTDGLPAVLDAAADRRCLLVGHSDGASIAAIHAGAGARCARARPRADRAALLRRRQWRSPASPKARHAYEKGDLRRRLARHHADVDSAFRGWNDAWLDPALSGRVRLRAALAGIGVPVLQIQGGADPYGTTAQTEAGRAAGRARRCGRSMLPGIGHAPHLEAPVQAHRLAAECLHIMQFARATPICAPGCGMTPDRFPAPSPRATATGGSPSTARWRRSPWMSIPRAGLFEGYELKLNSYDLGVDIELARRGAAAALRASGGARGGAALGQGGRVLRRREHPHARRRLARHKVNFCKFTNETRIAIEDASARQRARPGSRAVNGPAAGGGYELALTAEHIMLVDDRRSRVSLPETALLAVLPGTGGLTRVTDKRRVRRDRADVFCSVEEGVRGRRAVEWRLVDEVVPPSRWEEAVRDARARAGGEVGPAGGCGGHHARPARARGRRRSRSPIRMLDVALDRAGRKADAHAARPAIAHCRPIWPASMPPAISFYPLLPRARARRCDPASALQRARARHPAVPQRGRCGCGACRRCAARGARIGLAGARDPAYLEARAEARRSHRAQPDRADRARKLLRRHARGTRLRGRSSARCCRASAPATTARRPRCVSRR